MVIEILRLSPFKFFTKEINSIKSQIERMKKDIKRAFNEVKKEFDEHLDTINENTTEIQANYEYLCKLDAKIDKLNEKIEELQLYIYKNNIIPKKESIENNENNNELKYEILPHIFLTKGEREVFLAIYTLTEQKGPVSYKDIARKTGITEFMAREYITNLIEKGIPIIKRYINREAHIDIDKKFREIQARENIININEEIAKKFVE